MTLRERFQRNVRVNEATGCWIWIGSKNKSGYGQIRVGGRKGQPQLAHRVSWELHRGPITGGMHILHNCPGGDNAACVNPDHLFLGTHRDNMTDAQRKGQMARGARNGMARLTESTVTAIREACTRGERQRAVAERFGVSQQTVSRIVTRDTWRHL